MREIYVILIFMLGFFLGNMLAIGIYDRIAYSQAKFFCKNIEPECKCRVEGKLFYYRSVYYWYGRKVEKEF